MDRMKISDNHSPFLQICVNIGQSRPWFALITALSIDKHRFTYSSYPSLFGLMGSSFEYKRAFWGIYHLHKYICTKTLFSSLSSDLVPEIDLRGIISVGFLYTLASLKVRTVFFVRTVHRLY